jgi:hypothetical protein
VLRAVQSEPVQRLDRCNCHRTCRPMMTVEAADLSGVTQVQHFRGHLSRSVVNRVAGGVECGLIGRTR